MNFILHPKIVFAEEKQKMLNVFYVKDIFIVPIDILARLCKMLNIIIIYVPT